MIKKLLRNKKLLLILVTYYMDAGITRVFKLSLSKDIVVKLKKDWCFVHIMVFLVSHYLKTVQKI